MEHKLFKYVLIRLSVVALLICTTLLIFIEEGKTDVLELDEVSATYTKFASPNHSAYFPQEQKDAIAMDMKSSILTYGFFNTNVHGTSDDSQYRLIGLKIDTGIRLGNTMDIYYEHHSQHLLDTADYNGVHWPVEDSINFKLYFYKR